ncbi:HCL498Wp [Eremothecium sinecaudum]|uniref:HCL498Wp n=1 Tax=Eremothecium sinecaudum TaxID=45286 RepID=A0A109UY27_9SACH|nr:HCL498Wp [Eremothecium sinecaudum]AMD19653.1 HCL498Wp [Eremothecium sinecaudum]
MSPLILKRWASVPATVHLPTIYALSTPAGHKSAIAVVRISGTHSKLIYHKLTKSNSPPISRRASLRNLYYPAGLGKKDLLDSSLTLYLQQPGTFTGEDMLELHLHGGKAVVSSVLKAIESLHDADGGVDIRYAQPGEFSMRGFQNGKFDLTQIEGIGELIDAETEMQRKSSISSVRGKNYKMFLAWRKQIVENVAQLTAIIDFGEDADISNTEDLLQGVFQNIVKLKQEVEEFIRKTEKGAMLQSGIRLTLLGAPNAGKSSLLNKFTEEETAIVSSIPGTTRDSIDVPLDINGYKVVFCDTAGIRAHTSDEIEQLGISRTKKKIVDSDIVLLLIDPSGKELVKDELKTLLCSAEMEDKEVIVVINKADLLQKQHLQAIKDRLATEFNTKYPVIVISCLEKGGTAPLTDLLPKCFEEICGSVDKEPVLVSKRVQEILRNDVLYGIDQFAIFAPEGDVVMASEALSCASTGLGKITGEAVGVEEILGVVFSKFCVGK